MYIIDMREMLIEYILTKYREKRFDLTYTHAHTHTHTKPNQKTEIRGREGFDYITGGGTHAYLFPSFRGICLL